MSERKGEETYVHDLEVARVEAVVVAHIAHEIKKILEADSNLSKLTKQLGNTAYYQIGNQQLGKMKLAYPKMYKVNILRGHSSKDFLLAVSRAQQDEFGQTRLEITSENFIEAIKRQQAYTQKVQS